MNPTLVHLDPTKILADDNSRFSLKPYRIQQRKAEILAAGGVNTPVEVEPLAKGSNNGYTHRLTAGFYRHAAVLEINKEGGDLKIPAIPYAPKDNAERLRRQLSENMDRENQSPMDIAVAIKKLMAVGLSRTEIRALFARPGGKKAVALVPASNAFINMMLSFLDLPKAIQTKIHDGRIGVAAAYQLTKLSKEEQESVLAEIEAARLKALEKEEAQEQRDAKAEQREAAEAEKAAAVEAKAKELRDAVTETAAAKKAAADNLKAAQKALTEASKVPANFLTMPKEQQKPLAEALKAAKTAHRDAEKLFSEATKAADKAERAAKVLDKTPKAKETKPAPEKAAKTASKPVGPREVKKAAKAVGAKVEPTALTLPEVKENLEALAGSSLEGVAGIASTILDLIAGKLNVDQVEKALAVATGEGE